MNKIKTVCLFFLIANTLFAQEKNVNHFNTKKWVHSFGIGNSFYRYPNFPKGRNEINYRSKGEKIDQSKGSGLVIDAKLQYRFKKNCIGIHLNYYFDRINSSGNKNQTLDKINNDKLSELTIYDNQKYLNLGLNYERELSTFLEKRASFNASVGMGYSINLTPERLEYDYYYQDFLTISGDTVGNYRHTSTIFRGGVYINPAINLKINSSTNHGMLFELSYLYQWHKAYESYTPKKPTSSSLTTIPSALTKYNVHGVQLKFIYFF